MLKSSLCDYSDAHILENGTITFLEMQDQNQNHQHHQQELKHKYKQQEKKDKINKGLLIT